MCLLLETIKLNNGVPENIHYHNLRLNAARAELFNGVSAIQIEKEICVPDAFKKGLYRCRITCGRQIELVEFIPVQTRIFKRLKIIRYDRIDYHLKYADRSLLAALFAQRENADEIIIVKNELITDCTIGNLVFFDGINWMTPDTPLLKGTQRQALIDRKMIFEKRISEKDLNFFKKAGIINAFFDLNNMPVIKIRNIFS